MLIKKSKDVSHRNLKDVEYVDLSCSDSGIVATENNLPSNRSVIKRGGVV